MLTEEQKDDIINQTLKDVENGEFALQEFQKEVFKQIQKLLSDGIPREKWDGVLRSIKMDESLSEKFEKIN